MSTAINNSRWTAAFAEELEAEDYLDDLRPIPFQFVPPSQPKDFRRASYGASLPIIEEIPIPAWVGRYMSEQRDLMQQFMVQQYANFETERQRLRAEIHSITAQSPPPVQPQPQYPLVPYIYIQRASHYSYPADFGLTLGQSLKQSINRSRRLAILLVNLQLQRNIPQFVTSLTHLQGRI